MLSPQIASHPVAEHSLCVFYELDAIDPAGWTGPRFGNLTRNPGQGIPADQKAALQGRYAEDALWEADETLSAGDDFHAHLQELLSGARPDLVRFHRLTERGHRFLSTACLYEKTTPPADRIAKRLRLSLTSAAKERIAAAGVVPGELGLEVESLSLALFMTAQGLALCRFVVDREDGAPLSAVELLEATVALSRLNEVRWIDKKAKTPIEAPAFSMAALIGQMVFGSRSQAEVSRRLSSHAMVRFDAILPITDRDRYALMLARHYTTDYQLSPDIGRVEWVRDFETVRHAIALEGAATVIGPTEGAPTLTEFLRNFRTSTFDRHYLPIAILALHERAFLVARTAASIMSAAEMLDAQKSLRRLAELREAALVLRLCYRFSEQSHISMHNAVNLAWRKVLRLDEMLAELDDSIRDIADHLERIHRRAQERKFAGVAIMGGAIIAGFSTFSIVKDLYDLFKASQTYGWIGVCVGGIALIGVAAFAHRKSAVFGALDQDCSKNYTVHAMLEKMTRRSKD